MGRTAIYMVMGVSFIFLFFGKTMNDSGTDAFENAIAYYESTQTYNIAVAGANLACNQIFLNTSTWRNGFSNVSMNGGTFSVSVDSTTYINKLMLTSVGIFQQDTHIVKVLLSPSTFAKFAFYGGTHASAAMWETGDTIGGPSHTQGKLKTYGGPVFQGKATSLSGLTMTARPPNPVFQGGFQSGVNIPMPSMASYQTIYDAAADSGYAQSGGNLYLIFNADGTVQWKTNAADPYTTESLSSFAPNGIIAVDKGTVNVEGTVNGRITIASIRSGGSSGGKVNITNNLVYADNPRTNPNSNDVLGVVSYSDVTIMDNGATQFDVNGSFYSYNGGLQVENFNTRPAGNLRILGGMMVEYLYATSNGASGTSRRGYNLKTEFDERMSKAANQPDYFPSTSAFEILSWLE